MLVIRTVVELRNFLDQQKQDGASVGFVPTMGALHEGHLALVRRMHAECNCGVVSIFVNPAQFNEKADLKSYPRPVEDDILMLNRIDCDVLFLPDEREVYPEGIDLQVEIDLGHLESVMEGKFRPGHFEGVVRVMYRLLNIVQPDKLFMGQKDFQQTVVVRRLISTFDLPVDFVMCPTTRDLDGLAMSSRNMRLSKDDRQRAVVIPETLQWAKSAVGEGMPYEEVSAEALQRLENAGLRPEYFEIADPKTLIPVRSYTEDTPVVICVAAWAGNIRLIDNMLVT